MADKDTKTQTAPGISDVDPQNGDGEGQSAATSARRAGAAIRKEREKKSASEDDSKYMRKKREAEEAAQREEKDKAIRRLAEKLTNLEIGAIGMALNDPGMHGAIDQETRKDVEDGYFEIIKVFGVETSTKFFAIIIAAGSQVNLAGKVYRRFEQIEMQRGVRESLKENTDK